MNDEYSFQRKHQQKLTCERAIELLIRDINEFEIKIAEKKHKLAVLREQVETLQREIV